MDTSRNMLVAERDRWVAREKEVQLRLAEPDVDVITLTKELMNIRHKRAAVQQAISMIDRETAAGAI